MNNDSIVNEAIGKMGLTEEQSRERYRTDSFYRATIDTIAHGGDIHKIFIQLLDSHNLMKENFENYIKKNPAPTGTIPFENSMDLFNKMAEISKPWWICKFEGCINKATHAGYCTAHCSCLA